MRNNKVYIGAESKFGITVGNTDYIVKQRTKDWNNVLSEYVASRFINNCGVRVHNTVLAVYKGELCVVCEDFTNEFGMLKEFGGIVSELCSDKTGHQYFFNDVLHLLNKLRGADVESCLKGFMIMYLMDAILGNSDRHIGNWGLCNKNGVYKFSPIYDNGASLFPRSNINELDKDWMHERCTVFPNSKVMFKVRKRSNYKSVIQSGVINAELVEFARELPVVELMDKATEGLDFLLRKFYRTTVYYRHMCVVRGEPFKWIGII
jgi:hypothetical protein